MNISVLRKVAKNDQTKAGQLASRKHTFGDWSRYAVFAVHTRFDAVQFFVADAEREDPTTGQPEVIRQADSFEQAVAGL